MLTNIPIIDLFAGPGGLGEGFSRFATAKQPVRHPFKIVLSIEKDPWAHRTLELRSFYRQFINASIPPEYYQYLRQEISRDTLFSAFPAQAKSARAEALLKELGVTDDAEIVSSINAALCTIPSASHRVLIGGPPCQAYSVIGRSRMGDKGDSNNDKRHFLYLEYLKVICQVRPSVFVMENVKGLLSSKVDDSSMFERILRDLRRPVAALDVTQLQGDGYHIAPDNLGYRIYSLVIDTDEPGNLKPSDYIVKAERYGIPQARHRIILIGVRNDIPARPTSLAPYGRTVPASDVLSDLPRLRSQLSARGKETRDSNENWSHRLRMALGESWITSGEGAEVLNPLPEDLLRSITSTIRGLDPNLSIGSEFVPERVAPRYKPDWFASPVLGGVCNHTTRSHITQDLYRYLFAACYAKVYGCSPKIRDFPLDLLPAHKNVSKGAERSGSQDFEDRFRVQLEDRPSTTVTAHISKDGHYHIHYDPGQCRSLTVREAARLQTFPDDYFFEGPRTEQYKQVGNAVPPLLAYQIAESVYSMLEEMQ